MIPDIYRPFLKNFGVTEEFDARNQVSYLIKKIGHKQKTIVVFFNGIGLDYSDFLVPFVLSSSENILIAPTIPGFEAGYSGKVLTINEQARKMAQFVRHICSEHTLFRLRIYGFSYGSDFVGELLTHLIQYHKANCPRIEKIILTEINVDEKSCFITSKIKQNESCEPGTRHIRFFEDILKASECGKIDKSGLSDLSSYFSRIISKNWQQLIQISGEVIANPVERLESMIGKMLDYPEIGFSVIFSDIRDRESFESTLKRVDKYSLIHNLKISSVQGGHFSHIKPEGIYRNLELI